MPNRPISFINEVWGLRSPLKRLKEALLAVFGDEDVPRTKFGLSSLSMMHPSISIPLWMGRYFLDRKIVVTNLFNHIQPLPKYGWSVRKTRVRDFRGKTLTYDSHNGTDLAVPVRTRVVAPAPGKIIRVWDEFNRGGRKLFIDHGDGLITGFSHLSRTLVQPGDDVYEGQSIAYSGYSGIDGLLLFSFNVPHVHLHVWLNGDPCDPFSLSETPMWHGGNSPKPSERIKSSTKIHNEYDAANLSKLIDSCKNTSVRNRLKGIDDFQRRVGETIIEKNFYPTRFSGGISVYKKRYSRSKRISLPFTSEDFDDFIFYDEIKKE